MEPAVFHTLKPINLTGLVRLAYLTVIFLIVQTGIHSQTVHINGIIRDEQTLKPVQAVNIKVEGTTQGTSTDKSGSFALILTRIPVKLIITCLGYENIHFDISERRNNSVEILLRPTSYPLGQVDISSKNYSFLFKDKDYSILDYELLDSNLLLVVFRNNLKHSELILLTRNADTLVDLKLPEGKAGSLFKDFLSNVHYFSKTDTSYQCYYNKNRSTIDFLFKTSVDSTVNRLSPFIFRISDRFYFQEKIAGGFGTAIGYYRTETGKKYIRQFFDEKRWSKYIRDQRINKKGSYFNPSGSSAGLSLPKLTRGSVGMAGIFQEGDFYTDPEFDFSYPVIDQSIFNRIDFYKMIYPVIKTKEGIIAFLNFSNDVIELMDENGDLLDTIPITFHKNEIPADNSANASEISNSGWRWNWNILIDEYTSDAYTTFKRNGMVKIERINLETGKLYKGTVLPYAFPEKIKIYRGEAFFLIKRDGTTDNWKLMKCIL